MSRVLRAAPLMLNERSNILTSTEKPITSNADPPDRGPQRTQAREPRIPCDIVPQYGIISIVMIPAVSSGATWTLSLRNFLWTCITQVQSTFATGKLWHLPQNLLMAVDDDEMFMTRNLNVMPKTAEQHLIVRSDKYVAYATNNKRQCSTFCTIEGNY